MNAEYIAARVFEAEGMRAADYADYRRDQRRADALTPLAAE